MLPLAELQGESPALVALREEVGQLLRRHPASGRLPPLLILGETGTGKGLLARAIHRAGPRAGGPFVSVNCAAIPETLLEAELFGYERGAFTDARHAKAGLFQTADHGVLFLDEVGLLPIGLQAKLLTALEDRAVRRLGSTRAEPVDVWVMAAASADLAQAVRAGRFREELYHRLAVVTLRLPPLRERAEDVLRLAEHFLARACADYGLAPKQFAEDARAALSAHRWPGNVRELANLMERVALLSEAPMVTAARLGLPRAPEPRPRAAPARPPAPTAREAQVPPSRDVSADEERAQLVAALDKSDGNVSRAAARLGITRNTFRYRMRKHGLARGQADEEAGPEPGELLTETRAAGAVPAPDVAPVPVPAAPRWARLHVALLRVDLVGLSPGDSAVSSQLLDAVIDKALGFGGQVEEVGTTGLVAAFGLQPAEDAPRQAAHAALAIQKAAERARGDGIGDVRLVMALHVGELLVGRAGGRAAIDRDARREAWGTLEALVVRAEASTILLSAAAAPFLERRFALVPTGELAGPAGRAYRLAGSEPTGLGLGAGLAPFVGRERELDLLHRCWEDARRGGLRVVDVVGEAGIGKSRLVHEFRERLRADAPVVLQSHCTADGRATPFGPAVQIVRGAFALGEGEPPDAASGKLCRGLARLGLSIEESLPVLQALLGLPTDDTAPSGLTAAVLGARTRETLAALVRARAQLAPAVLIVDDVHWADGQSHALLEHLVQTSEGLPLLVVGTYRPPHRPPWAGRERVTELRLEPLGEASCLQLVRHRLGSQAAPLEVARRVVERAEGNPLFAEELARYLAEQGDLARGGAGISAAGTSVTVDREAVALPATLRHLLAARLEPLAPGPRAVLEAAAVIGRRASLVLLRMVMGPAVDVPGHLKELEAQGLLARDDAADVDAERVGYRFRHVLIQEAVYERLTAPQRAALHETVAKAIERLHVARLAEWAEALAHHYAETPRADRAVRYLAQAGHKSLRVYALTEADHYFRQAVELIEAAPGCADAVFLVDTCLAWGQVYFLQYDHRGLASLLERCRPQAERLGDPGRLSRLLAWLGMCRMEEARNADATALLEEAKRLAESAGDEEGLGYAGLGLLWANQWVLSGDRRRELVEPLGRRLLELTDRTGDFFLRCQCLTYLTFYSNANGRLHESRAFAEEVVGIGRRHGVPPIIALGLRVLAQISVLDQRYEEALEQADEALRLAQSRRDVIWARTARGTALAFLGRAEEAIEVLRETRRERLDQSPASLGFLPPLDMGLGAAMLRAGEIAAGVRWLEDAIRRHAGKNNDLHPARGQLLLGEFYLALARGEARIPPREWMRHPGFAARARALAARKARQHFEEAVRLARSRGIEALLARGLLGLGQLCAARGRRDEGRVLLEEARQIAEPLKSSVLSEQIRKGLDALAPQRQAA